MYIFVCILLCYKIFSYLYLYIFLFFTFGCFFTFSILICLLSDAETFEPTKRLDILHGEKVIFTAVNLRVSIFFRVSGICPTSKCSTFGRYTSCHFLLWCWLRTIVNRHPLNGDMFKKLLQMR